MADEFTDAVFTALDRAGHNLRRAEAYDMQCDNEHRRHRCGHRPCARAAFESGEITAEGWDFLDYGTFRMGFYRDGLCWKFPLLSTCPSNRAEVELATAIREHPAGRQHVPAFRLVQGRPRWSGAPLEIAVCEFMPCAYADEERQRRYEQECHGHPALQWITETTGDLAAHNVRYTRDRWVVIDVQPQWTIAG